VTSVPPDLLPLALDAARAAASVLLTDRPLVLAEGASTTKSSDTRIDAFYESDLSAWDWAAGALLATEAGATLWELAGPDGRGGVAAATPALAGPLRELLTAGE
jgi:hypothetical protein